MFKEVILVVACCYAILSKPSLAITQEQLDRVYRHLGEFASICSKNYPLSEEDAIKLKKKQETNGENVACYLYCFYSQIGLMNDQGMLVEDKALEIAKQIFTDGEEALINNVSGYISSCSSVNSKPVNDGDEGCERAYLIYRCLAGKRAQYGFIL